MKQLLLSLICATLLVALAACSGTSNENEDGKQQTLTAKQSGGDETLLEYRFKIKMKDSLKPAGHLKLFISDDAVRSEMNMQLFGKMNTSMIMLASMDNPEETILLNTVDKTYQKMNIELPSGMKERMDKMTKDSMIVVGQEEMNGFNCTYVKVVTTYNMPASMSGMLGKEDASSVTKYWLSKDISGYGNMREMLNSRPKMMNGIDADVYQYGVPVKQVNTESGKVNFVMELVKAEEIDIPDDKFEIPDGYTNKEG